MMMEILAMGLCPFYVPAGRCTTNAKIYSGNITFWEIEAYTHWPYFPIR
jgi:hypothetical protein